MISIIHPQRLNSAFQTGGIETWINDYLRYSSESYVVLGVNIGEGAPLSYKSRPGVLFKAIANFPSNRSWLPNLFLYSWGLMVNRHSITNTVLVHRIELVPIIKFLKPKARIMLIVHTDLKAQLSKQSDSLWRRLPWLFPLVEKLSLLCADGLMVYSKEQYCRYANLHSEVQRGSSWYDDKVFFHGEAPRATERIVWVGRFETVKDPLLAIEVFGMLAKHSNTRVAMIGAGSLRDSIKRELANANLATFVDLKVSMSAPELADELRSSNVLLQTSSFEGSPRILIEALACGVRIVSTQSGDPDNWSDNPNLGAKAISRRSEELADLVMQELSKEPVQASDLEVVREHAASRVVPQLERWLVGHPKIA